MSRRLQHSAGYWTVILVGWFVLGVSYSMSVTPSGRLLWWSGNADDRPALFAGIGAALALLLWPAADPNVVPHEHPDLSPDHPHQAQHRDGQPPHNFVIDDEHPRWPG